MSSGASSDAGGASKTANGDEGRAGNIVHPGGDAVPKKVIWGQPSQCVPAEINGRAPARFASNVVITSKYTVLNFTPLFLFEQFQRVANIYFIFVSLFEFNFFVPVSTAPFNTSLTGGSSNTFMSLCAVIILEGITVIVEDYSRHKSDAVANNTTAHRYDAATRNFVDAPWREIEVGDIVRVDSGEKFPGDLLMLCAATAKGGGCGAAYVETKSLDGETNLKLRTAPEEIVNFFRGVAEQSRPQGASGKAGGKWELTPKAIDELLSLSGSGASGCAITTADPRDPKTPVSIHTFGGVVRLTPEVARVAHTTKVDVPINEKNVLLRECVLRNTAYAYAVVVNTGVDTKLMKSSTESRIKVSDLDKEINKTVIVFFFIMILLCCIGAAIIAGGYDSTNTWFEAYYTALRDSDKSYPAGLFFQSWALLFVGLAQMIPIALLVQLRMARIVQGKLINWDKEMVHVIEPAVSLSGKREEIEASVRTVNLVDELGQLSFIFSDKTGTLTQNIMEFRKCSIDGVAYGRGTTMIGIAAKEREGKKEEAAILKKQLRLEEAREHVPFCNFIDGDGEGNVLENGNASAYQAILGKGAHASPKHKQKVEDFFRCLALCHSVEVEHRKSGVYYSASSPDEQALVAGAKHFGFLYEDQVTMDGPAGRGAYRILRRAGAAEFDKMAEDETKNQPSEKWRILDVLEFTSKRKRMSVIVKDAKGNIRVITKGADSKVFDNLNKNEKGGKMHVRTKAHAAGFANDGLRTLGVGQRMVGQAEFAKWKREMDALRLDPVEVKKKKAQEDNKIDDKAGEMEIGLSLLGATAIEDKLQVGVPDAIADLARAGIKLWVLTGDKEDTAINIGFACKLLRDDMHCAIIRGEWSSLDELRKAQVAGTPGLLDGSTLSPEGHVARTLADRVHTTKTEAELRHELVRARQAFPENKMKYVVIDGKALDVCLDGPVLRAKDKTNESVKKAMDEPIYRELLKLSVLCDAVVCCRVSPLQKALMVSLVKDNSPGLKTLAIGDGANDVPMIQTAHIGVGIAGQEGMQAVRASDFAVGQFRFLRRLTLVHGRSNYRKGALMLCYMFYKNIVLCLAPYFYKAAYQTAEDGISRWIGVSFYNVIHTAWPILLVAFYDFDISPENAERFPRLYHSGPDKRRFNVRVFLFWTFLAFLHSIIIFAFAYYGSGSGCIQWNLGDAAGVADGNQVCQVGQTTYLGGHITTLLLCTVVTVKIASEFARVYWWTIMPFLAFSLISYPVMMLMYTAQIKFNFGVDGDPEQQHKVAWLAFQFGTTWLSLLGCLSIVVIIDAAIKYVNRRFYTQFEHLVHEVEAHGTCFAAGKQLGDAAVKRATRSDSDPVLDRKEIALAHLDAIDQELWGLEKAGLLEIPGPKLPSFPEVEDSGSIEVAGPQNRIMNMTNPLETPGKTRERTASELEMGGWAGGKKSGGAHMTRHSVASINAAIGGMSMDHHAAETVAGSLRRHISESEGIRRSSL